MPTASGTAAGRELSVLVIEDDSHLLRSLRDILGRRGYKPLTAQSAREGLALVEQELPAVALVDLKLPDMDGVEVIDRLTRAVPADADDRADGQRHHRERAARAAATHLRLPGQAGAAGEAADDDRSRRRALAAAPRRRGAAAERGAGAAPARAHLRRRHGRRRRARLPLRQPVGPPPARLPAERAGRPAVPRRGAPRGRRRDRDLPPRRASPRRPDAGTPAARAAAQRRLAPARDRRDQPRRAGRTWAASC